MSGAPGGGAVAAVAPRSAATAQPAPRFLPWQQFQQQQQADHNLLWILLLPETGDTCAGKMVIVLKNFIGGEFVETKNTSSDNVIER